MCSESAGTFGVKTRLQWHGASSPLGYLPGHCLLPGQRRLPRFLPSQVPSPEPHPAGHSEIPEGARPHPPVMPPPFPGRPTWLPSSCDGCQLVAIQLTLTGMSACPTGAAGAQHSVQEAGSRPPTPPATGPSAQGSGLTGLAGLSPWLEVVTVCEALVRPCVPEPSLGSRVLPGLTQAPCVWCGHLHPYPQPHPWAQSWRI